MKRLAIISERTRYHFQKPLDLLKEIEVIHFYKSTFADMETSMFKNMVPYDNAKDLYKKLSVYKPDLIQGLEPYYGYTKVKIPFKIIPILRCIKSYSKKTGTPYFFHILENLSVWSKYGWSAPFVKAFAKSYCDSARFVFYLNQGAKKNLEDLSVARNKIHHGLWGIWGVDRDIFYPEGILGKDILYAAKLSDQKGIKDFLEATKEIDDRKIVVAGEGPLEKIVSAEMRKRKNIEYLGSVKSHLMGEVYRRCGVFVSPSKSLFYSAEQVGMSNIEAMACGLPVVGYDSGSVSEFVPNGKAGILLKEGDVKALKVAINKLINSPDLQKEMSLSAVQLVRDKYDAKKNVKLLEETILSLL